LVAFDLVFLLLRDSRDDAGILFMLQSAILRESAILHVNVRPKAISPNPLSSLLTTVRGLFLRATNARGLITLASPVVRVMPHFIDKPFINDGG